MVRALGSKLANVSRLGVAAALLLVPRAAMAQYVSASAPPLYGTVSVYGMSPASLSGVAGGPVSFSSVDSSCRGYGAMAPSHVVMTSGGTFRINAMSSGDTTLMVMGPDGRRYCDDDGGGYPNPQVDLSVPAGPIAIWVGSYSSSGSHPYNATVAPQGGGGGYGGGGYGGGGGAMFGSASYPGGYDPVILSGTFGGPIDADTMGSCAGYISAAPSHTVMVSTYVPNLRFVVRGDADTTLVVQYADGHVACNDDGGGYPHPLVEGPASPGTIRVWVGSYGSGGSGGYVLGLTTNPGINATNLGGGSPPVVVTPPPYVPPVVTPPVVVTPPSSAVRVELSSRIPVTLYGFGVTPTVAVWSPRGGPSIEVSAMPNGSVISVSVMVGGVLTQVVDVPSSMVSGSIVTVTQRPDRRLLVRAERAPGTSDPGSTMLWLVNYARASGAVEIANTWVGTASERAPGWAR